MKQLLLIVLVIFAVLGAAAWVASWFWAGDEVASSAAQPWPDGLGTVDAVPGRYPPHGENEAARKLTELAAAVAGNDAITAYVRQEIAVQHGGHLVKVPMYLSITRALLASALARARQNDVGAWDDLHAAWNVTKSLDGHPHLVLRVVAMSMTRAINAVAWKMPLPAPAWFSEAANRDFVRPFFETLQYEKWWGRENQLFPLKPFAETIDRERALMTDLARVTECEFRPRPATRIAPGVADISDLDISWQRVFRYRVEREATANALRARAGQAIEETSHCSDGRWSFDGKTLSFAKAIPLPEKIDTSMPLTLDVSDRRTSAVPRKP